jgi:phosphoglucomutase
MGDTRGQDRAVGAGIMLTPSRNPSSPLGFQDQGQPSSQGLTALTQNVISGKVVHRIGARITPEDVKKFEIQKKVQLRSSMFLLAQLDADIDANALAMIELKLENSKALAMRPGPWRLK